ncbi:MAG: sensor histidine kinase [Bryobacteraceae bacterium]
MPPRRTGTVLADAADVLSDQLRDRLTEFSQRLAPHAEDLDHRFLARLRDRFDEKQSKALCEITVGAAAGIFSSGGSPGEFFEHVEYSGRRLAKLNVPPADVLQALHTYDLLLEPLLRDLLPQAYDELRWAREQLQFCVVLTLNNAFYQVREAETQAFYELFRAESEGGNLGELLERLLGALVKTFRAGGGFLLLLDPLKRTPVAAAPACQGLDELPRTLLTRLARPLYLEANGAPDEAILDSRLWSGGYRSWWSIPFMQQRRLAGVVQLGFATSYQWLPRELDFLKAAGERCLLAAERTRLIEDLEARSAQVRDLSARMLQVEEEERSRISRELHDEAGQSMLCIRLQLEMLEKTLPPELDGLRARIGETREVAERTILEIRRIIADLRPAVLDQLGLAAALRQLVNRVARVLPAKVRLSIDPALGRLPRDLEIITYRLFQECLNNAAKHARATEIKISLRSADERLMLRIVDNGVGFQPNGQAGGFGLTGIRERVALLRGQLDIESRPGSGTKVSIQLPIR